MIQFFIIAIIAGMFVEIIWSRFLQSEASTAGSLETSLQCLAWMLKIVMGYSIVLIGQIVIIYEPRFTTMFGTLTVPYKATVAI